VIVKSSMNWYGAITPSANCTFVTPVKPDPLIVTIAPGSPAVGVMEAMEGATLKSWLLGTMPAGTVTLTTPVVAPSGTSAFTVLSVLDMMAAGVPLNVTAVAPANPGPLISTSVPTGPVVGERLVIVGTVNVVLLPTATGVVTWIDP